MLSKNLGNFVHSPSPNNFSQRIYYLDALRAFIMFMVIIVHGSFWLDYSYWLSDIASTLLKLYRPSCRVIKPY